MVFIYSICGDWVTVGDMDMVMSVSNLSRSGIRDWVIQRLSALILFIYVSIIVGYCLGHTQLSYQQWQGFFHNGFMQLATFLVALSVCAHIWIGIWTVITDYVKPTFLRMVCEILVLLVVFGYFFWIFYILFKL